MQVQGGSEGMVMVVNHGQGDGDAKPWRGHRGIHETSPVGYRLVGSICGWAIVAEQLWRAWLGTIMHPDQEFTTEVLLVLCSHRFPLAWNVATTSLLRRPQ